MGIGCSDEKRAKLSASMKLAIARRRAGGEIEWGRRTEHDYSARVERRLKYVEWERRYKAWEAEFGPKRIDNAEKTAS